MQRCFSSIPLRFPPSPVQSPRRVVVTGMGCVTPLGIGVESTWNALLRGECGVKTISSFDTTGLNCTIAAQVYRSEDSNLGFNMKNWIDSKNSRSQSVDFIAFALAAASEAIQDSGWKPSSDEEYERAGVAVGGGIGNIQEIVETGQFILEKKYRRVSPFFIPRILINMAAGQISMKYQLKGPNHSVVTACATGSHSIGDAYRFIKYGDADIMIAGGTEASINPTSICGFLRCQALTTSFNDTPELSSRPFDKDRSGFVMGEGAGILVLEELEHAVQRGAKIYGEVRGYGLSGDAHHITAPPEDGDGARRAMLSALQQAGLNKENVGYINAHATSTPLGDLAENHAIISAFGLDAAKSIGISATKGATGHLLGAAGAVEAIFALKALHHNILPPTINLMTLTSEFQLNYVPNQPQEKELEVVMSNSFGFGGTNTSLCFSK